MASEERDQLLTDLRRLQLRHAANRIDDLLRDAAHLKLGRLTPYPGFEGEPKHSENASINSAATECGGSSNSVSTARRNNREVGLSRSRNWPMRPFTRSFSWAEQIGIKSRPIRYAPTVS